MSVVLAIDPGTNEGAFVVWDCTAEQPVKFGIVPNAELLKLLRTQEFTESLFVETIASFGMPVGKEVFETCMIIGRMQEIAELRGHNVSLICRLSVKLHHCHSPKAKDSNIRQALVDRFGAPGTKNHQGKLYGVSSHIWSALAIAVMASDTIKSKEKSLEKPPESVL